MSSIPSPPVATGGLRIPALRTRLLKWFDRSRRDLPWRHTRDPYRIWVSEVMLQQTTVAAVVPYYERFLAEFPTVSALAAADEQEVLKLWEGLGYYRRARHLHAAATQLAAEHGDALPDDPALWAALPGIGRYILGAVLSQAFDRRLPIVEANSRRVLARLVGLRDDPRRGDGERAVWAAAEALLPRTRCGDFNQALMELGALVCRPQQPRCGECPWRTQCFANRDGLQALIPPPNAPPAPVPVREVGVAIRSRGKLLLCRRRADADRWQNLWEVPHGEVQPGEADEAAAERVARELAGLAVQLGPRLTTLRHTVTKHAIALTVFAAARTGGRFGSNLYSEARWLTADEFASIPVSAPQRKLLTALATHARS